MIPIPSFLKRVPLFSGLPGKDLNVLARIARVREVKKGENIFSQASSGDTLYVVVKGTVKIFSRSRTGKTKTFAYLESREFFGEMALLEPGGRSAAAVALTPATLLTIHRQDFQKFLRGRPEMALALLRALCARLRSADHEIESLSFNSVLGRISSILLDLSRRHGKKDPRGLRIDMEMSHKELADMAGTAREMVTRALNRLVRTGCVEMDGRFFIVTDAAKLRGWIF